MKKCEYCAKEISYFEQYCDNYTPKLFGAWNYVDFTPFSDRKYDFKA